jgi:hypothetical protein
MFHSSIPALLSSLDRLIASPPPLKMIPPRPPAGGLVAVRWKVPLLQTYLIPLNGIMSGES